MTRLKLTILCALFIVGPVQADFETRLEIGRSPGVLRLAGTEDGAQEQKVYIVQLRTPAAAEAR